MKTRPFLFLTLIVAAAMAAFAFWTAGQVPAGTELPTHWNASGEVDGTMPALQALLLPVGLTLFVGLTFAIIPAIEPLQEKLSGSAPLLRTTWLGTVALMVVLQLIVAGPAYGYQPGYEAILAMVGVLLVVLGNMLPKSRPGFFVGIRTPWTITNADNWVATHRLGGKLFMLAGAAIIAAALIDLSAAARMVVVIGAVIAAALVPTVYSWWLWHRASGSQSGA